MREPKTREEGMGMGTGEFKVQFVIAKSGLSENEKAAQWEPEVRGKMRFEKEAIRLDGKWKMGVIGNVLTFGLAQPLMKRMFARDRSEVIPLQNLERVVIIEGRHKHIVGLWLYEKRQDSMAEVHVFSVIPSRGNMNSAAEAVQALRALVPANLVHQRAGKS